jgi:hypothetical protein
MARILYVCTCVCVYISVCTYVHSTWILRTRIFMRCMCASMHISSLLSIHTYAYTHKQTPTSAQVISPRAEVSQAVSESEARDSALRKSLNVSRRKSGYMPFKLTSGALTPARSGVDTWVYVCTHVCMYVCMCHKCFLKLTSGALGPMLNGWH